MIIKYINTNNENINLKNIDTNKFSNLSKIYSFTTENIAGYYELLNLKNENILTVVGSGDHIINAFYKGAKKVTGFDINYLALIFTELKLVAIQNLEYEEFLKFFMINDKNDLEKNKNAFDYKIYNSKLRNNLTKYAVKIWDEIYKDFNYKGFEIRNSYLFNNQYDNNTLKIDSNLYLRDEKTYKYTKKTLLDKEIKLINSDYKKLCKIVLQKHKDYSIIFMSNISDYAELNYVNCENYLEEYIKDIVSIFENSKIVCAYIYDINKNQYRSYIDNPNIRKEIFEKLNINYIQKEFKSVIDNCKDGVIII